MAIVEEFSFGFKDELFFVDDLSQNDLREEEVIAVEDIEPSENAMEGDASKEDCISKIGSSDHFEISPLKTHECGHCSKMFATHAKMLKHYKIYHQENVQIGFDGKRSWVCSQCQKQFVSRKGWIIHQRSHTGERPYSCSTCGKSFIDSSTLMKHQVIHQAVRPFTCDECGHGFNQKVALQRHEKTHNQQQEFGCGFCPKTFLVKCSLQAHEKIHSGVKPFQCKYCSATFHTLTALRQHKRVHMNEQPPTCLHCKKTFPNTKTLSEHMEIHSSSTNLPCPICPQSFNLRITLRKHIRAHVARGNIRFCNLCQMVFQSKQETIVHFDKHIKASSKNTAYSKVVDDCGPAVEEKDKDVGLIQVDRMVKEMEKNGDKMGSDDQSNENYSADNVVTDLEKIGHNLETNHEGIENYSADSVVKDLENNGYNMGSNDQSNYSADSLMKDLEKNGCNMGRNVQDFGKDSADRIMKVKNGSMMESGNLNSGVHYYSRDSMKNGFKMANNGEMPNANKMKDLVGDSDYSAESMMNMTNSNKLLENNFVGVLDDDGNYSKDMLTHTNSIVKGGENNKVTNPVRFLENLEVGLDIDKKISKDTLSHSNRIVKDGKSNKVILIRSVREKKSGICPENIVKVGGNDNNSDHFCFGGNMLGVHENGYHRSNLGEGSEESKKDGEVWKENGGQSICDKGVQERNQDGVEGEVWKRNKNYTICDEEIEGSKLNGMEGKIRKENGNYFICDEGIQERNQDGVGGEVWKINKNYTICDEEIEGSKLNEGKIRKENGNYFICDEGIQERKQNGVGSKIWKENQSICDEESEQGSNGHPFEDTTCKQNMGFSSLEALCNVAVSAARELPDFHPSLIVKGEKSPKKNSTHRLNGIGFFCKACNRMYSSTVDFRKHRCNVVVVVKARKRCKVGVTQRVFTCEECDKSFRSKNGFLIHQRSHTGERPYPCRWCEKAFGDSGTRHKHERIHTGERPFQCVHCPRAFNQRAALRAHQVTHSVCFSRSHTCKICPSSFSYFANLRRHVITCHREFNALPCPLCSTRHRTLHYDTNSLHEHVSTSHLNSDLKCPICDFKDFKNVSAYCSHIVSHAKRTPNLDDVQLNNNSIKQEDNDLGNVE